MSARDSAGPWRRLGNSDLYAAAGLAVLALLLGLLIPENVVSGFLSTLLVLVLPGYALFVALNASPRPLAGPVEPEPSPHAERVVLSLALSIALVVLGSLVLNALPPGMTQTTWRVTLTLLTVALALYAMVTRTRAAALPAASLSSGASSEPAPVPSLRDIGLLAAAAIVLGVSLGLGGVGVTERPRPPFTQFWALPRADGSTVEVGIRNDEGRAVIYHLYAMSGEIVLSDEGTIRLAPGETWQWQLPVAMQGAEQGINLLLYRDDAPLTVYRSLRIAAPAQGAGS